jgi:hypothetical protein
MIRVYQIDAVEQIRTAIDRAGRQGLKLLEVRAATDLARLWAQHGQKDVAVICLHQSIVDLPRVSTALT